MKTVGDFIKQKRYELNISRVELGEMTHIKTSFIKAIEESDWEVLPELPVVTGFVKSIAHFLDIDEGEPVALLRRSYSLKKPVVHNQKTAKQNFTRKFSWGPRMTFAALVVLVLLIISGYLIIQYQKFNAPPNLDINQPTANQKIIGDKLEVIGKTDPDATVVINNQPVVVEDDGNFMASLDITTNTKVINIIAKSRSGKTTTISRTIEVQ